jgi:transcriptional regulator with XRE-family HTH domain
MIGEIKGGAEGKDLAAIIGRHLRAARRTSGLSKNKLSHMAGVTLRSYIPWERGDRLPRLDSLIKIAKIHGKPVRWFLGEDE